VGTVFKAQDAPADPYDSLTAREREVLPLAAEGDGCSEIAARTGARQRSSLLGLLRLAVVE
jgi:DNA-binding CsgD family transcriptional regulator